MAPSFAALLYRPDEISDRALSLGFAVCLGGFDAPRPRLSVVPLPGLAGWSAAFYSSGVKDAEDDFDHACELFEDDLIPPLAVLDAAAPLGAQRPRVFALLYSEDAGHDDGYRVDLDGVFRHFVREGEGGTEWGVETPDEGSVVALSDEVDEDDLGSVERALRPHRGSTFLSSELSAPVLAALMGALFADPRVVPVHLVAPSAESIAEATRKLVRTLKREAGRGAFTPPPVCAEEPAPAAYAAFAETYDFEDPRDPKDLYRELSLGRVEGTLHFLRAPEIEALRGHPSLASGLYPAAKLLGSSLQASHARAGIIALGEDGESLWLIANDKAPVLAGPTFGELIAYLALGWSKRTEAEEDMIGALMLKAAVRARRDEAEAIS